ncbi:O-antigen ligase family protein [Allofrancisella guangzhouensis]|nr:O-antigen ligase family protein [Allofrancisella guangzhouensis]MBK2043973.1 O-antigen ligase family protein [Allofrancisella guangzhouensis]MBK2045911.1 O-antigen ligase family protein [Allofrancisella guangzhouensis]
MPFMPYSTLNLIKTSSGGKTIYLNDILSENLYLFKVRYLIFYYTLCICSIAIIFNKKLLAKLINYFKSFSKLVQTSIGLFFIFGLISSSFAISPSIAFKGISVTFLQFICVMFVAHYASQNFAAIKKIYTIVLLSLIFFGGSLFLHLLLSNFSIYGQVIAGNIQKVLLYTYNCLNPRFLDNYFSWFIPLLLLPWFVNLRPIFRLGSLVALVMVWFVLINHAFRTVVAEYIIILPLLALYNRKMFKLILKIFTVTIVIAIVINFVYINYIMAVPNQEVSTIFRYDTSGRMSVWIEAFKIGLEHPFTGIGQWNYIAITKYDFAGYPHNLLLEIWSQWGIPAFIVAIIVIFNAIKNLFRERIEICVNPYYCMFIMMLTAGMIDSMLNAMFKTSLGLFGCVFVFGFCLSIFKPNVQQQSIEVSGLTFLITRLAVFGSLFCIVVLPLIFSPMWI